MTTPPDGQGRVAQRRRTRKAIVDATISLLAVGGSEPSIGEIADAADVSRRTVYLHFPTLDQLILDATVGAMNPDVDAELAKLESDDPRERVTVLITALTRNISASLPMGRRLIKLTVDAPPAADGAPRRGYRRVRWIEWAVEPLRMQLSAREFEDLISALALVIGWEAFITLIDVRGLSHRAVRGICIRSAVALIDNALT